MPNENRDREMTMKIRSADELTKTWEAIARVRVQTAQNRTAVNFDRLHMLGWA